jgi:putative protease
MTARKAGRKTASGKKKKKAVAKKSGRSKQAPRKKAARNAPASARGHPAKIASRVPERIGTVRHYYPHAKAGILEIDRGELRCGDVVHFRGHTTDFFERIERIELDAKTIEIARAGDTVGVELTRAVRENDAVYLLSI